MPYQNSIWLRRTLLSGCVSLAILSAAIQAQDNTLQNQPTVEFSIQAQSLGAALKALALQSNQEIFFSPDQVRGKQTQGVSGQLDIASALATLLDGTGLTYEVTASNVLMVKPESTAESEGNQEQRKKTIVRDSAAEVEEMVVTGSRIARSGFTSPTPTMVVDNIAIEKSGLNNIGEILLQTPSVGPGLSSATSNFSADAGGTFIDLRAMGTDRTLTLINGRRRVSGTSASSAVDLSTIPASMVERIEVITGGASAVYGADAVTGVVNVVLRKDFEGLEISGRQGLSQHGGADSENINIFGGTSFADDRGSISFGVTYNKEEPLMSTQRDFARKSFYLFPNENNTGPNDGILDNIHYENFRLPNTHPAGTFFIGNERYTVDPNLRLTQNDQIFFGEYGFLGIGGDGFDLALFDQLRIERESLSIRTNLNYEITDSVNFFAEADFAGTEAFDRQQPTFDFGLPISRDNPFVPDDLGALMDANGLTEIAVARTHYDHGIVSEDIEKNSYTIAAGFEGTIADNWDWETFYQYGRLIVSSQRASRIESRFFNALDAIADPGTGEPICRSDSARAEGCVPLNILGQNAATPEALAYFQHLRLREIENTQKIIGAQITGTLFQLPAGPLQIASGVEYRQDSLSTRPDGLALTGQLYIFDNDGAPLDASMDVSEGFVEVLAPIVADKPFFQSLNIESAIRYSDYDTIGSTVAWKLGVNWSPVEDLRFRVTRSESVRAPNLTELFIPRSLVNAGIADPCDMLAVNDNPNRVANCAALGVPANFVDQAGIGNVIRVGGNPSLQEETSNSFTLGAVFTPRFVEGLSISLDYWSIEIEDAINTIDQQTVVERCVDLDSLNNPFCALIKRGDDFIIEYVDVQDINIGKLTAKGIDLQALYGFSLADLNASWNGEMRVTLNGTYLMEHEELVDATDPDSLIVKLGGPSYNRVRASNTIGYSNGPLSVDLTTRYIGKVKGDVDAGPELRDLNQAKAKIYNDIVAAYNFENGYRLYFGVNNLFDVIPPRIGELSIGGGNRLGDGGGAYYDNIGRYFFFGGSIKF